MNDNRPKMVVRMVVACLLVSPACFAQSGSIEAAARKGIDAGNQAWIDGMKQGLAAPIAATYAEGALDCTPTGECLRGRSAIEQHMKEQIEKLGRAQSASVNSMGSVQQKDFVYEWGRAEASFANGKKVMDRYLTVWQRQPDGSWKIFRNMVISGSE
jgi:ketosteroid isomerase-like protein